MRILLIEDQQDLAAVVQKGLEEQGYNVDTALDGEEGLYMAENFPSDAIVLDILLPKMDGLALLGRIRKKGIQTPVLLLTAKDALSDKIKGLDSGADDYLTKPFAFAELLARIRALLRRKAEGKEAVLKIDDLEIDTASHEVRRAERVIRLSAREFAILQYLAYHNHTVVTRTQLIEHIYPEGFEWDSNIVDVYINRLRNKIDKGFTKKLIHTLRGTGYRLKDISSE
ncbi:MAG: response regulator transcription factor [Nitrospirae bacterium]|nr:response regulator transcription factor [Nitrospirota bacterium]